MLVFGAPRSDPSSQPAPAPLSKRLAVDGQRRAADRAPSRVAKGRNPAARAPSRRAILRVLPEWVGGASSALHRYIWRDELLRWKMGDGGTAGSAGLPSSSTCRVATIGTNMSAPAASMPAASASVLPASSKFM